MKKSNDPIKIRLGPQTKTTRPDPNASSRLKSTFQVDSQVYPAPNAGRPSKTPTETRPASVQVTVTEDSARSGRPLDDSRYGPSLWTGELGTPDGSRAEAAGANRYSNLVSGLCFLSKKVSTYTTVVNSLLIVVNYLFSLKMSNELNIGATSHS